MSPGSSTCLKRVPDPRAARSRGCKASAIFRRRKIAKGCAVPSKVGATVLTHPPHDPAAETDLADNNSPGSHVTGQLSSLLLYADSFPLRFPRLTTMAYLRCCVFAQSNSAAQKAQNPNKGLKNENATRLVRYPRLTISLRIAAHENRPASHPRPT
jgi:hypothetical protein